MASSREKLNWFSDMDGNEVHEGDKVIVAVYTGGFVIGEVVEGGITGIYAPGIGWSHYRVKVKILKATPRKDRDTMTYDRPHRRMLKLPEGFLD